MQIRQYVRVSKALVALFVVVGTALAIGTGYLYVTGASVPLRPADPLAFTVKDGDLMVKVGTCVAAAVTAIEVQATDDGLLDDDDPIVWSFRPADGSARTFSTRTPGQTRVSWDASVLDAQAFQVTVSLAESDRQLGGVIDPDDLSSGAVVEGERRTTAAFDTYSTGTC